MFTGTFVIYAVFALVAAFIFGRGLVNIHRGKENARSLVTTGLTIGVWGVFAAAVAFGFFNL
jgi:hypothetical protein